MGARYPYYLLTDSPEGQRKESKVSRTPPKETPTHNDIRQGFVYKRVPHITLRSIANNVEIDVIWEKWQETLEPLRARLDAHLQHALTSLSAQVKSDIEAMIRDAVARAVEVEIARARGQSRGS